MGIFDIILLIILAGFVFYGLFFGLIRTLGSLVGVIVGAWLASRFYLEVFSWVKDLAFGFNNLGKVVVFIILFALINRLVCFIFVILDRTFDIISIIPFLKTINRLAGAFLGLLMGGLILGLILYVAARYAVLGNFFGNCLANSEVAPRLIKFAGVLTPLLPEVLKKLQSLI
ncbi:MAG: CvpA family protein [Patescibacteria group bacterium]|nr:CvpA family protein [Patescibacteria group bacterium]